MKWNYTKTAAAILLGVLVVKIIAEQSIGENIFRAGGAIPSVILGAIVLLPIMVVGDLIAARKNREERRD